MNDLRTAAQQALEFCEFLWREVALNDWAEGQREAVEAALRAALAQEQAEPVQAISECIAVLRPMVKGKFPHEQALDELVGYTAPPQRKPLTDEEAATLVVQDNRMRGEFSAAMELIRRTERAHNIKE